MRPAPMADELLDQGKQEQYLACLADPDITPDQAAAQVGLTGTKMRALRKRDLAWDQRCRDVEEDRRIARAIRIVEEAPTRAKISDRIYEVLLATYGPMVEPAFAHLRRDRVRADVKIEGTVIQLPPDWELLPVEEKKQLRAALAQLGGRLIEQGEHPVIDA